MAALKHQQELYRLANQYGKLLPWRTMEANQIFAVKDPGSETIGYCSILGFEGKTFGLAVYRGEMGLDLFLKARKEGLDRDQELQLKQVCNVMSLCFCRQSKLSAEEIRRIKNLGIDLSWDRALPSFGTQVGEVSSTNLSPGEVTFFSFILNCAINYVQECRNVESFGKHPNPRCCLLYVCHEKNNGGLLCEKMWHEFKLPSEKKPNFSPSNDGNAKCFYAPVDAAKIESIKSGKMEMDTPWELTICTFPGVVSGRKGLESARGVLIVHADSEFIIKLELVDPEGSPHVLLREELLAGIQQYKRIPRQIYFNDKESLEASLPAAEALGIAVHLKKRLPKAERVMKSLKTLM